VNGRISNLKDLVESECYWYFKEDSDSTLEFGLDDSVGSSAEKSCSDERESFACLLVND
jgi:hypothetical protein